MPDSHVIEPDFHGLATAVAGAFKPDFADVRARAARRRRRFTFGGLFAALVLLAGGGTAVALTADHTPSPVRPTPAPTIGAWHTLAPGAGGPQPQPSYTRLPGGAYDVTKADQRLTGLFTELQAGDVDHLYLEYQDCVAKKCRRMLAASADRGHTWSKLPMPDGTQKKPPSVVQVYRRLVVAMDDYQWPSGGYNPANLPAAQYWTSVDGGVTWRRPVVRTVAALPAGWPLRADVTGGIVATDPATGDMARIQPPKQGYGLDPFVLDTPPAAGIWLLDSAPGVGLAARVSADGGRTWDVRALPPKSSDGQINSSILFTVDGRTVWVAQKQKDGVDLQLSTDGGRTWQPRAQLTLGGPLLSLLPVGDRTVIVEGPKATFRSTDQGRTFTEVGPSLGARGHAIPGGYTIPTNNNEYSAWLSTDGATWTYVHHPQVP